MKTHAKQFGRLWTALLLVSAVGASAVPVTFRVNMGYQISQALFDPATGLVEARGDFQSPVNWTGGFTLTPSLADTNIYEGTYDVTNVAPGATRQYKFVVNGTYEGNPNRAFILAASAQTLPAAFYGNIWDGPAIPVSFQVNMSVQTELGRFDPALHTVEAHGSFDNWGAGFMLTNSPADTNIYSGTFEIPNAPGSIVAHKYVVNRVNTGQALLWEGNVGVGQQDRTFPLAASNQTLPVVHFDNVTYNPGAGIPVTFQVNMAVRIARGQFNPASDIVDVRGQLNATNTWDGGLALTNDPINTNIFSGVIRITTVVPGGTVAYKFNAAGTWEGGDNHTFTLASPTQTLAVAFFDGLDNLGPITLSVDSPEQIIAAWFGGPLIRLQTNASPGAVWQDVPDSVGQSSLPFPMGARTFFRLIAP